MPKITLKEAEEAFEKANRTKKSKLMDKVYTKKKKFLLDVDDERGSNYLKPNGTSRYDFKGIDDGVYISVKTKNKTLSTNAINKIKKIMKEHGAKQAKVKISKYTEKIRGKIQEKKKKERRKILKILNSVNEDNGENKRTIVNETLNKIKEINGFLYSMRKSNFKTEENKENYKILVNAIDYYDFYPTPPQYSEIIYNDVVKKGMINEVFDIACGFGSLSLPFIDDKDDKIKHITMIEFNKDFFDVMNNLNKLEKVDVINSDFFKMKNDKFELRDNNNRMIFLCNPPFQGINSMLIDHKKFKAKTNTFYLDFLFKIINIGVSNEQNGVEFHIYIIMPKTYFVDENSKNKEDFDNLPKATMQRQAYLYPQLINDDLEIDFIYQIKFMEDVKGFKTLRQGRPVELNQTFGLYKIVVFGQRK